MAAEAMKVKIFIPLSAPNTSMDPKSDRFLHRNRPSRYPFFQVFSGRTGLRVPRLLNVPWGDEYMI